MQVLSFDLIIYLWLKVFLAGIIKVIMPIIVANQSVTNLIKIALAVEISKGIFDNFSNPNVENSVAPNPPGKKDNAPIVVADKCVNKESLQDIFNWLIVLIIEYREYPSINQGQMPIKRQGIINFKFINILNELRKLIFTFSEKGRKLNKVIFIKFLIGL